MVPSWEAQEGLDWSWDLETLVFLSFFFCLLQFLGQIKFLPSSESLRWSLLYQSLTGIMWHFYLVVDAYLDTWDQRLDVWQMGWGVAYSCDRKRFMYRFKQIAMLTVMHRKPHIHTLMVNFASRGPDSGPRWWTLSNCREPGDGYQQTYQSFKCILGLVSHQMGSVN